jgi:hypothetical protein
VTAKKERDSMKFVLCKDDFSFLKKNAEDACELMYSENSNEGTVSFEVKDVSDFMVELNFAIVDVGMDNQDTVNRIGKRLYNIYDEILYQKRNQTAQ